MEQRYSRKELEDIFRSVIDCNLSDKYPELAHIEKKLYIVFKPYSHWLGIFDKDLKFDYPWQYKYVLSCVNLFLKSKYKDYLDDDLLDMMCFNSDFDECYDSPLIDRLNVLFEPNKIQKKSILQLLDIFYDIFHIFVWFDEVHNITNFTNNKINELFKTVKKVDLDKKLVCYDDYYIIFVLIVYCYANDINCDNVIYRYINNKEYYKELLSASGVNIEKLNYYEVDEKDYKKIYEILPFIINKKSNIIMK